MYTYYICTYNKSNLYNYVEKNLFYRNQGSY